MKYGVCDVETLGTDSDAVVLSAAFVVQDLTKSFTLQELVDDAFYMKLSAKEQIAVGRHVAHDTVVWWKKQNKEAQQILKPLNTDVYMAEFNEYFLAWATKKKLILEDIPFGARGFIDFSILYHIWKRQLGIDPPIPYWNVEEIRTALKYIGTDRYAGLDPNEVEGFVYHSCKHDAALDWLRVQKALREVGVLK
ncbi:MAG: 3'-5' exoribonuclease [Candidatus Peribacteraceae bacterium]|nr:3'-5' exoribonuclease [Candidatus Peribacteraceae bacterium]